MILGGSMVYFGISQLIGAFSLGEMRSALKRARGRGEP
jgi:hypothetical protein